MTSPRIGLWPHDRAGQNSVPVPHPSGFEDFWWPIKEYWNSSVQASSSCPTRTTCVCRQLDAFSARHNSGDLTSTSGEYQLGTLLTFVVGSTGSRMTHARFFEQTDACGVSSVGDSNHLVDARV